MNVEVYPFVKVKPHWDAKNRDWRVCPFVIHRSVFDIRHSEMHEIAQLGIVTQPGEAAPVPEKSDNAMQVVTVHSMPNPSVGNCWMGLFIRNSRMRRVVVP